MTFLSELCAWLLYAAPLLLFIVVRARRNTTLVAMALDVPIFVAADLFSVILVTSLVPLEIAVVASRALWILGMIGWAVWRRMNLGERPEWPTALGASDLAAVCGASAVALWISTILSRTYNIWDRHWHVPQVTAIATQRLPFVNVFESSAQFRYHYAGNVFAAELRALSMDVMSSARALSVVHDLMYVLTAATLTLLLVGLGQRRLLAMILSVCFLLYGPIRWQEHTTFRGWGFLYPNNATVSFRPHVALAVLLLVGWFGALSARALAPNQETSRATCMRLVVLAALLSLTDEASLAACDIAIGVAWLVDRRLLSESRRIGAVVLVALGAVSALPTLKLSGSFSPGGPVQKLEWVAAQLPPAEGGTPIPWTNPDAKHILLVDLLPMLLCIAGVLVVLAKRPSRRLLSLVVASVSVVSLCTYVAMHLQLNGHADREAQRFFVAPFLATLIPGLAVISLPSRGVFAPSLVFAGVVVPAAFTTAWVAEAPINLAREKVGVEATVARIYSVNCRKSAGSVLFDARPQPTYVESSIYFIYASCRGVFVPGGPDTPWPTKIYPHFGDEQLRELYTDMIPRGTDAIAVCRSDGSPHDRVCAQVLKHRDQCWAVGDDYVKCLVNAVDRDALLK